MVEGRELPTQLRATEQHSAGILEQSSDPLPGESESQYVARQRALQEQARERMRQKFGNSSGLSSSGKMQGIGSDPGYNPGASGSGGSLDPNQVATQAFSFVNSVWETTTKVPPSCDPLPVLSCDLCCCLYQTVQEAKIGEQVSPSPLLCLLDLL
jgi:hypothetical protein